MTFERNQTVNVVDEKLDGTLYYEGQAKILRCIDSERNIYKVEFDDGRRVIRRLYPTAQKKLLTFIKTMNDAMQESAHAC